MAGEDTDRILNKYGQPDDEHGMLFSRVGGDLKFNPYEAIKKFMAYRAPPGALSTSGDDTPVRHAADAAGWVGLSGLGLNAFGAVPANALGSAGAKAPQALRAAAPPRVENPIRAYHGSPHDFDKFDLSKIGTGEGAQAYGHGLYLAENEGVARSYRDTLSADRFKDGTTFNLRDPAHWAADALREAGGDRAKAAELLSRSMTPDLKAYEGDHYQRLLRAKGMLERGEPVPEMGKGHMYEVAIHATPDQFLDWDKPLSQQSEAVRRAIGNLDVHPSHPASEAYRALANDIARQKAGGTNNYGDPATLDASHRLRDSGVAGIRYLDQGSRGAGNGTSNYVVFDPERIEILSKYGLLGPVAGLSTAEILQRYGQDERE